MNAALADMGRKLVEAQEQERTRIARELHDDVSQRLALVAIGMDEIEQKSARNPELSGGSRKRRKNLSKYRLTCRRYRMSCTLRGWSFWES